MWVGGLRHPDPAKHVAELAAAPRELPLVLVGPTRPWAHELPDVILTGQVSDEQLAAIYSGAHALVLSSEDEGFGLPAVEALACGTPVVACDAPALREVLGERADVRRRRATWRALIAAAEAASRPAPAPPAWSWQDAARATWGVYAGAGLAAGATGTAARSTRRRPARPIRSTASTQRPRPQHPRRSAPPRRSAGHERRQTPSAGRPRASVGAAAHEHGGDRLQQDRQVERQRPALEVDEVEVHEVVEVELRAP